VTQTIDYVAEAAALAAEFAVDAAERDRAGSTPKSQRD
jgi:hypothetical protein